MQPSKSRNEADFDLIIEGQHPHLTYLVQEAGGHRWQRIPPTERRGRVHTSTVTVAVFELKDNPRWTLRDADITTFTTKDSGPGGQHRNKTETCIVMRHEPTKIEAKAASKSQAQNRKTARAVLEHRVLQYMSQESQRVTDASRKQMMGSGQRGDKIRTYREQDGIVTDHRTDKKARLKNIRRGNLQELY